MKIINLLEAATIQKLKAAIAKLNKPELIQLCYVFEKNITAEERVDLRGNFLDGDDEDEMEWDDLSTSELVDMLVTEDTVDVFFRADLDTTPAERATLQKLKQLCA